MAKTAVKIAVSKVITSLEAKVAEMKAAAETEAKAEEKFQKELNAWQDKVIALALKNISKVERKTISERGYDRSVNVDLYFPREVLASAGSMPERKDRAYINNSEIEELEQTLRILAMCDDEYVSASTLSSVSRYL